MIPGEKIVPASPIPGKGSDNVKIFGPFGVRGFTYDDLSDVTASILASNKINQIDSSNWLEVLQRDAASGDVSAREKLLNYYMTEESHKTARDWTAQREDSAYQRLVEDMKLAGISPYALSGGTPSVSNAQGATYNASQMTSESNNKRSVEANERARMVSSMLAALGIFLGATARAAIGVAK